MNGNSNYVRPATGLETSDIMTRDLLDQGRTYPLMNLLPGGAYPSQQFSPYWLPNVLNSPLSYPPLPPSMLYPNPVSMFGLGERAPRGDNVTIPAKIGEYVIPEEVVRAKGTDFFDSMVKKYRGESGGSGSMQRGYQAGGQVGGQPPGGFEGIPPWLFQQIYNAPPPAAVPGGTQLYPGGYNWPGWNLAPNNPNPFSPDSPFSTGNIPFGQEVIVPTAGWDAPGQTHISAGPSDWAPATQASEPWNFVPGELPPGQYNPNALPAMPQNPFSSDYPGYPGSGSLPPWLQNIGSTIAGIPGAIGNTINDVAQWLQNTGIVNTNVPSSPFLGGMAPPPWGLQVGVSGSPGGNVGGEGITRWTERHDTGGGDVNMGAGPFFTTAYGPQGWDAYFATHPYGGGASIGGSGPRKL